VIFEDGAIANRPALNLVASFAEIGDELVSRGDQPGASETFSMALERAV
jgi:hypothetical protein